MTLDTIVRRVNYQGDDRTTCFSFPFKVWGEEQVVVYCSDPATPWTETNITQRTTITLNADNYGGAVVFVNPPAAGSNLAIVREGNFLQEDEYLSGSRFDAHEIEDRFDEDAAERQELLDATARSIKVPNSSTQTPEEIYEELLSSVAFVNNAIATLTELYNQALYYYNLTMGYLGATSYMQSKETSFTVDKTHIIDSEGEWVHTFYDDFRYYPTTHQLLVTVDGLALTPEIHFSEIGKYGTESSQIRFKINMYQGQQVYIKAMFLGTEAFSIKLQEMDDKIEDANNDLQNAIDTANRDFENKTNELNSFVEETTNTLQAIVDGLDKEIAQTASLVQEALEIVGTTENWKSFQGAITELNSIYATFTSNELATQGYCVLNSAYSGGSCLTLPGDVCYFKGTNTLHLAIDGLVLSPKYFEEVGGCICTNVLQETCYYGAKFVKICEGICLYKCQELHAWTESYWGRAGWEPEVYQADITTRLYATSTSGCVYHSDDLGRSWSSYSQQAEEESGSAEQLPEYLRGQRIVATSDTLWAFTAPQEADGNQEENHSIAAKASATEQEDAAPPAGTLMCSTDGGLTWDCYIKNGSDGDSNSNGWQSFFGDPYTFAVTDDALVLATCNGLFCCPTGGTWASISSLPWLESDDEDGGPSQEESAPAPKCRQRVCSCSCTNNISNVTAIAGNGQYWVIADACGQVEYAANCPSSGYWQTAAQVLQGLGDGGVTCIYGTREGFVALGSGTACTASPRNAWKYSTEFGGTLCAGLHLPDHGLYLAVGGDASCAYTLWSWDGLNWNCGCGVPNNAVLNNIWTSEHLPIFTDEPVTALEPMSPAAGPEDEDNGTNDGEQGEDCYLWGPISPTYQLKSDLCFDSSSIPVRITIDQNMPEGAGTDSSYGNGATIAIYKSDTYQRLTREDLNIEDDNGAESLAASEQAWCEFARYEACGPINADTELYTCFTTAGQNGSGEALTASESYPTCWPAGYYAVAIYCVYGGCSLQKCIPKINFYVSRKERYSSYAAEAEPDDAAKTGSGEEAND